MAYCKRCGTALQDDGEFCQKCGLKREDIPDPPTTYKEHTEVAQDEAAQNVGHVRAAQSEEHGDLNSGEKPKVNNTFIWFVAFFPLLGLIIENIVAVLTGFNIENLWWITLVLNIVFCLIDSEMVKKAYPNYDEGFAWVFLIPIYLYKRAKFLKDNFAYFIVWMVVFAVIIFVPYTYILDNPNFNFGFGSSTTIQMVKEGKLDAYPEKTIGDAVDDYLTDEKWTSFQAENGELIVEVSGEANDSEIQIQFLVEKTTFEISYAGIDGESLTWDMIDELFAVIYGYS